MQDQFSSTCAAIDIGSNTIHIVVARCGRDDLDILADEVELVRIGESVTATGAISPRKRDTALETLKQYKALAEQHHASPIFTVATEAIRKASNNREFITDVQREVGLEVRLVEGDVEATLTFWGATYERSRDPQAPAGLGVMDLGGGSMELITAKNKEITWRTSVPVGSGWLHDRYLPSNPPTRDELSAAYTFLKTYFRGMSIKHHPPLLTVTGGSANSLFSLACNAFDLEEAEQHMTHEDIVRCEGLLYALPAEEIAQRYQQPEGRAHILPAGALIIRTLMEQLRLDEIWVSPHGIREGVLLAYARYGDQWLQRVQELVSSSDMQQDDSDMDRREQAEEEPFSHSGRRILVERTEKFLEWRDAVLQHDDPEAVHKMRVASRRLRAALDAYEPICEPQQFKKVYKRVKKIADLLGDARDTDVMIQNLRAQAEAASQEEQVGIQWFIDRLHSYRQQQQQKIETFFGKFDERAFAKQVESCFSRQGVHYGKS